jgi:hypothetical protein
MASAVTTLEAVSVGITTLEAVSVGTASGEGGVDGVGGGTATTTAGSRTPTTPPIRTSIARDPTAASSDPVPR